MSALFNSMYQPVANTISPTGSVWVSTNSTAATTGYYAAQQNQLLQMTQQIAQQQFMSYSDWKSIRALQWKNYCKPKKISSNAYHHPAQKYNIATDSYDEEMVGVLTINAGERYEVRLPDGAVLSVQDNGAYVLTDKDAKITYKASRIRDFNRFINASDRIEEFIRFCGEQGVRSDEMLNLPVHLFIGWLVLEAAKQDKEPVPDIKLLPDLRARVYPHCPGCGRFVSRRLVQKGLNFCRAVCYDKELAIAGSASGKLAVPA